jgi:3-deoxy-D-manno-octulosonic-acid transferase
METEIWPCLYRNCERENIPIALINARLSEKSLKGYRLLSKLTSKTLQKVSIIAAQSSADTERFILLGASRDRVINCGNIKFDMEPPRSTHERADAIRHQFSNRPILIAASTHEGEDEIVLDAYRIIKQTLRDCLLIIAPRHPERSLRIADLCRGGGYLVSRYSDEISPTGDTDILILDTIGQLQSYYAASDISFVGGSLVPVGGHNMLEPAALGVPVISGENLFNFEEVSRLLLEAGALIKVKNAAELADSVLGLFQDHDKRARMAEMGKSVVASNRGSTGKIIQLIEKLMAP